MRTKQPRDSQCPVCQLGRLTAKGVKLHLQKTDCGEKLDINAALDEYYSDGYEGPIPDPVNAPPHYTSGAIECIDAIQSALTQEEFQGFLRGNVLKYLWRYNLKGGNQDLNKASWYLDKLIKSRKDD